MHKDKKVATLKIVNTFQDQIRKNGSDAGIKMFGNIIGINSFMCYGILRFQMIYLFISELLDSYIRRVTYNYVKPTILAMRKMIYDVLSVLKTRS